MGLTVSNIDRTQVKSQTIQNQEQKVLQSNDKKYESQQFQQKALTDAINEIASIDILTAHISFSKDDGTGDIVIKIIDNNTDKVIRQIPPEDIVELRKRLGDLQGLLLDKKV